MATYDDSSSLSDWSWVRAQRLRWDFVNALVRAADSHRRGTRLGCTNDRCCAPLTELHPLVGLQLCEYDDGSVYLDYAEEFGESVTSTMRDGMSMLSTYAVFQNGHPLEGHMEVPFAVGEVVHSRYFGRDQSGDVHVSDEPADERREILYAFACLAFPDEHLDAVRRRVRKGIGVDISNGTVESSVHADMCDVFHSNGYLVPKMTRQMTKELKPIAGGYGSGMWPDLAPYDLEFALRGVAERSSESGGLAYYARELETIVESFDYAERGNGYGTGMCFIMRSFTMFVSQQCWESGEGLWNACTEAYNTHLFPVLERPSNGGRVMVAFSDFRGHAYIVSPIKESWDEYAPMSAVHAPLPQGHGIVGVWNKYDESRYTPRSLDEIIERDYSIGITAAARYLKDCLAAEERRLNEQ